MVAVGDVGNPITFTAWSDDSVGGDNNGDGASSGSPGYWGRIQFSEGVGDGISRLENTVVRYGGSGNVGNVYLLRSNATIKNNEITDGSYHGINIYQASPLIEGNHVQNFAQQGIYAIYSGTPQITGNTVENSSNGLYMESSVTPLITDNIIQNNTNYGIYFTTTTATDEVI